MASPIGHAAVGLAAATVVARVLQVPDSAALWIGATVASGLPDLDIVAPLVGLPRRWHRGITHSLFSVALMIAVLWWVVGWLGLEPRLGVWLVWSSALMTHPLVDLVTTGPTLGRINWGIPLLWPFTSRRFFMQRPWLVGDRDESLTLKDTLKESWEDLVRIVPICAVVFLAARALL